MHEVLLDTTDDEYSLALLPIAKHRIQLAKEQLQVWQAMAHIGGVALQSLHIPRHYQRLVLAMAPIDQVSLDSMQALEMIARQFINFEMPLLPASMPPVKPHTADYRRAHG